MFSFVAAMWQLQITNYGNLANCIWYIMFRNRFTKVCVLHL